MSLKVLKEASASGVRIALDNGQLKITARRGGLTPELEEKIRRHKAELVALLADLQTAGGRQRAADLVIRPRGRRLAAPLSSAQHRLWFIDRMQALGASQYLLPSAFRIRGEFDPDAAERAFRRIIERHEVLRTVYREREEGPVQVVLESYRFALGRIDLTGLACADQDQALAAEIRSNARARFDLRADLMLRASYVKLASEEGALLLSLHHIAADGWSASVLMHELSHLYARFTAGLDDNLPPLEVQYADYAQWQHGWLAGDSLAQPMEYWRRQLADLPEEHMLPLTRQRPKSPSHAGDRVDWRVPVATLAALKSLAATNRCSLFMVLHAAWALLLSRYSGSHDIVIGTPVRNRRQHETERLIGFFVNSLVLRVDTSGNPTFTQFLRRVREVNVGAQANQDVPFEHLVQELNPARTTSREPLFQIMLSLDGEGRDARANQMPGLEITPLSSVASVVKFDLHLQLSDTRNGLECHLDFATELFERGFVQQMAGHFEEMLRAIVGDPARRIDQIDMLSSAQRRLLLKELNQTVVDYSADACVHELFEAQVERVPDAIAVTCDDGCLSYRGLNQRANQVAHCLLSQGVGPETLVGLCLERGLSMAIGLLGILKAGAAYVAVDPAYPKRRIDYMLDDSAVELLLSENSVAAKLEAAVRRVVYLDRDLAEVGGQRGRQPESNIPTQQAGLTSDHAAYVIYTSGSTGQPKGVLGLHRSVVNRLHWLDRHLGIREQEVFCQKTSLGFVDHVAEFFQPLCAGCRLVVLAPETIRRPPALLEAINEFGITRITLVPSLLKALLQSEEEIAAPRLEYIFCSGEVLALGDLERFDQRFPRARLFNIYGSSEVGADVTACEVTRSKMKAGGQASIGTPIDNVGAYVLDRYGRLQAFGVIGELNIGGASLARGYLNDPALTAEKFVPHPFGGEGQRLYRMGDLVRYRSDGQLAFEGRVDHQVKLRGFRIELGEIESVLCRHPQIKDAVVVVRGDDSAHQRLVAYAVPAAESGLSATEVPVLLAHAREALPDYMVPAMVVLLEQLPLTPSGKVDRRALPVPERDHHQTAFVAPAGVTEELLAGLWSTVLKLDRAGRHDNFFELGGHSLLATKLISRIRDAFEVELPIPTLFENQTIASQAQAIVRARQHETANLPALKPIARDRPLALSHAQERLWFLHQLIGPNSVYNMSMALRLRGELNVAALRQSLLALLGRHEALRTRIVARQGGAVQVVDPPGGSEVRMEPVSAEELESIGRAERAYRFDLSGDALCRIRLLRDLNDGSHVLLVTMHHIISDGWSMGVFFRELVILYKAFAAGRPSPLAPLPIQYADFAQWQRQWLSGAALERQLDYWREQLAGLPPMLDLPTDRSRPAKQSFRGSVLEVALSKELSDRIESLSRQAGVTVFMSLLSAFAVLLGRYSGQRDLAIGTPIANRVRTETEQLIGFFVNTLVLRSDLSGDPPFLDLLRRTREVALQAYAHQDIPFERLVEVLNPERSLSHTPLFQAMLILQNAPVNSETLDELTVSPLRFDERHGVARFDLTLNLSHTSQGISGAMQYNADLFDGGTVQRMLEHYQTLLEAIVADPSERISCYQLLSAGERHQQLNEWNATTADYPGDRCIHELFESQAAEAPAATALICGSEQMSYAELERRANQVAHHLLARGVGPGAAVGICVERSPQMMVGILGILKAGGAYVPLDPEYPAARIRHMLEDSGLVLVLTDQQVVNRGLLPTALTLSLDQQELFAACPHSAPNPRSLGLSSASVAYLIYTSGSTGRPKGVELHHRGGVNLAVNQRRLFQVDAASRVLHFASLSFDAATWEWLMALSAGATLCLSSRDQNLSPEKLGELLIDNAITHATLTPAVLAHLELHRSYALEYLIVAGEACDVGLAWAWSNRYRLINAYGPTETTVCATAGTVSPGLPITIGRSLLNTRSYVLDEHCQPQPIGVVGELYVAGAGLAYGYRKRAALTAEHFVPDPFACDGGRLYRTGDLVRQLENGELQFVGRADSQVKVRGFRIELGEIEVELSKMPEVRGAAVVARGAGTDKRLIGYVTVHPKPVDEATLIASLRTRLLQRVPDYMVPATLVALDELPRNANGKVDYEALPNPEPVTSAMVPPRTPAEVSLARIWRRVLDVEEVDATADFFELGGHSLLAAKLVSAINEEWGASIGVSRVFENPTLSQLAALLETDRASSGRRELLVQLSEPNDLPRLYLAPGAGMSAASFRALAQACATNLRVVVLDTEDPYQESPDPDAARLARKFARAILDQQSDGPYFLAGHSTGGSLAFEVARALQARNEEAHLLLLDAVLCLPESERGFSERAEVSTLMDRLVDTEALNTGRPPAADGAAASGRERLGELLMRAGVLPRSDSPHEAQQFIDRYLAQVRAYRCFVPSGKLTGDGFLIHAARGLRGDRLNLALRSLQEYCTGTVDSLMVKGDHFSMLDARHVLSLKEAILIAGQRRVAGR